jgi:hypothetical protein
MLFLQALPPAENIAENFSMAPEVIAGLAAIFTGFFFAFILVVIALYIYLSFAYMAIGKKAKVSAPGIAWIPGIGPTIIAFKASKMSSWPWWLLLSILIAWIPILGQIVYVICILIFAVYTYIWSWKLFEAVRKPGWWALIPLVSIIGLIPVIGWVIWLVGVIVYFVLIGITAWGK